VQERDGTINVIRSICYKYREDDSTIIISIHYLAMGSSTIVIIVPTIVFLSLMRLHLTATPLLYRDTCTCPSPTTLIQLPRPMTIVPTACAVPLASTPSTACPPAVAARAGKAAAPPDAAMAGTEPAARSTAESADIARGCVEVRVSSAPTAASSQSGAWVMVVWTGSVFARLGAGGMIGGEGTALQAEVVVSAVEEAEDESDGTGKDLKAETKVSDMARMGVFRTLVTAPSCVAFS
jgi:hypothetical protein